MFFPKVAFLILFHVAFIFLLFTRFSSLFVVVVFFLGGGGSVSCGKGDPYFKGLTSWNLLEHFLRIQTSQDYHKVTEVMRAGVNVRIPIVKIHF